MRCSGARDSGGGDPTPSPSPCGPGSPSSLKRGRIPCSPSHDASVVVVTSRVPSVDRGLVPREIRCCFEEGGRRRPVTEICRLAILADDETACWAEAGEENQWIVGPVPLLRCLAGRGRPSPVVAPAGFDFDRCLVPIPFVDSPLTVQDWAPKHSHDGWWTTTKDGDCSYGLPHG